LLRWTDKNAASDPAKKADNTTAKPSRTSLIASPVSIKPNPSAPNGKHADVHRCNARFHYPISWPPIYWC